MMLETRLHLATAQTKGREQIFFGGTGRELENESQNGGDDFSILFLYLYLVG